MAWALVIVLAAHLAGAEEAQGCALTTEESALVKTTQSRMASQPSAPRLSQVERYPQASCGVWRIQVGRDGEVRSLELTQSGGERALVNQLEPWLLKSRYEPAKKPWSGLVVVRLPEGKEQ